MKNRRKFVRDSLTATAGVSMLGSLGGCDFGTPQPQSPIAYQPGGPQPWINWAGNEHCQPLHVFAPSTEEGVVDVFSRAEGTVRPVGASHSFSALVPTDDTLVSTDLLSGLVSHDLQSSRAQVLGGTRIHDLGPLLEGVGQALPNMPDMDYPSIAGAMATSVHGTGIDYGSMSSYVVGLALVTPGGELVECSVESNPDLFQAARTSLGALGIVTRMTLQNQPAFDLTETGGIEKTEDVLTDLDARFENNRHFEFLALPHTSYSALVYTNLAQEGDVNLGEDDPYVSDKLKQLFELVSWVPGVGHSLYEKILLSEYSADAGGLIRTGASYKVFAHDRVTRFREMEYSVPVEAGPACLREILSTIRKKKLPVYFPIEYRHVKADDIWLSMYQGRDSAAISFHQAGDREYKKLFAEIEPIFLKYEGRPHWGKIHTLDASRLAALYPRHWQDFQEIRSELDPTGRMLNAHLKKLFLS